MRGGLAQRVVLDGVGLAYDVTGPPGGPPVVLLHALGESRQDWPEVTGRLAERFSVVAVDLRGHGDSDRTPAYSTGAMADDVARLLDHLDLSATVLVGHSLGGVVAYRLAAERPDLVRRLVIEDVTPPFARNRPVLDRPEGELPFDWAAVLALRSEAEQTDDALWAQLQSIAVPTLLIGGGPDSPVPPDRRRAVAELIPDCVLVETEAGHYVHRNRPDEFLDTVLGWLDDRS